jgi:hypothetical protein
VSELAGRARREASAVLSGASCVRNGFYSYEDLVTLCALSWIQGANYGLHEELAESEDALDTLKASL